MYGYLIHHGVKGQKWGVRRFQNADGSLTPAGKKRYSRYSRDSVFISGSSKTQDKQSGYYRKQLPKDIRNEIDGYIKKGDKILVGDAPGVDRQVQNYLKKKGYSNVVVYGPGSIRYSANKKWKTKAIDSSEYEPNSPEWLRKKDIAMTNDSTKGLAVVLENGGAKATRNNVDRLVQQGKDVKVYELSIKGDKYIQDIIKKLDSQ